MLKNVFLQVEFWIFLVKSAATFRLENTTIYLPVMDVQVFSNVLSEGTGNTFVKQRTKEAVLLTKHIEINAEHVVYKNVRKLE